MGISVLEWINFENYLFLSNNLFEKYSALYVLNKLCNQIGLYIEGNGKN